MTPLIGQYTIELGFIMVGHDKQKYEKLDLKFLKHCKNLQTLVKLHFDRKSKHFYSMDTPHTGDQCRS